MLTVWTDDPSSKVFNAIAPALKGVDLKIEVCQDLNKLPDGNTILALGAGPKEFLAIKGVVPKNRTLTSLRNQLHKVGDKQVLFSYSSGIRDVDYGMYVDLLCDARSAARVALTGSYKPVLGNYQWVDTFLPDIEAIKSRYAETGKPVRVALDTETRGRDQWHPDGRFVTIQISWKYHHSSVMFFKSKEDYEQRLKNGLRGQLEWLLNSPMVSLRLANGKFDMLWLWVHGGFESTNFKFDSTLVGSLLDENRSNRLDVHAKIYTQLGGYSDEFDQKIDKSRMDLLPKDDELLNYAGGDTDAELQVADAEVEELKKYPALTRFYVNILHPAARAFEVVERGGVFIDHQAYKELEADLRTEMDKQTKAAISIIGGRLYAKHRDPSKPGGINLTKKSLLVDFMFSPAGLNLKPIDFTAKDQLPSTSYDSLMKFKGVPEAAEFLDAFQAYSSASKALSTYVLGFQKHIRSDGRFHSSYFLHAGNSDLIGENGGTVTGRLSAKDPAFQTIPKHTLWGKRLRRVFTAPPGFLVLERDYSQGELRVVACIADEKTMITAYLAGMDLHVLTGATIAGLTYDYVLALKKTDPDRYDSIRQPAKPANFGLLYGQFPPGFRNYAENNYGVVLSLEEATDIRNKFFIKYSGLPIYHETYKREAHRRGYVVSPLGRIRHLPMINSKDKWKAMGDERKAINSPVQSTLADMMEWSLAIEWAQGGLKEAPCFGNVHDAAYDYVPEDRAEEIAKRKKEIMENLPFEKVGWKPQLKFIADVKLGKNMADLKELKTA